MRRVVIGMLLAASLAQADSLSVTVTTTPAGGPYAPKNVVAVWVQDSGGAFVKTIQRWSAARTQYLLAWNAAAGANDVDAVSGATRANHNTPLSISWDLKNRAGTVVPDGTYTIKMELADSDATSTAQNNEGTFTFIKGGSAQMQTGLSNGGFNNVTINFTLATCGNGTVEAGETCDPQSTCPTTCAQGSDACMPSVLQGSAATCDAACVVQPITSCVSGDGCCAAGCTSANDSDCASGGSSGNNPPPGNDPGAVTGGCTTTGGAGPLAVLAALMAAASYRRTRRLCGTGRPRG